VYFSVSVTTRDARPGELEGVHYRFVDALEFASMIEAGDLLEWAEYNGRSYGTPLRPVQEHLARGEDVLLEIEVQGAVQIRSGPVPAVMFFVVPPTFEDLEERLRRRGDTNETDIARRLAIARQELEQAPGLFDYVVVNDDLERCIEEVLGLMNLSCPTDPRPETRNRGWAVQ
jgi:guanylate kinase